MRSRTKRDLRAGFAPIRVQKVHHSALNLRINFQSLSRHFSKLLSIYYAAAVLIIEIIDAKTGIVTRLKDAVRGVTG